VNRTLLDLFEVAENPASDTGAVGSAKASLIYTDDTINTWTNSGTNLPLPEIILAQENYPEIRASGSRGKKMPRRGPPDGRPPAPAPDSSGKDGRA